MGSLNWEEGKEERNQQAVKFHARLSKLFREDRLAFERERRRLINEVINQASTHQGKERLRILQDAIDRKMRSAGSEHNRFVLMQRLFWDQVDAFRQTLSIR